MQPSSPPEAWLRAALPGIDSGLMSAAHALVPAREVRGLYHCGSV
jgi:hypothetical protein